MTLVVVLVFVSLAILLAIGSLVYRYQRKKDDGRKGFQLNPAFAEQPAENLEVIDLEINED